MKPLVSRPRRVLVCTALFIAAIFSMVRPASAYLKFGFQVSGQVVTVKWQQFPVRYFVNDRGGPGIGATAFTDAVGRAFGTWEAVPSAAIRYQFGGFTSAVPLEDDGRTTIGFLSVEGPEFDRVLASTSLLIDDLTGELLEADIFFNSAFLWSTSAAGEPGRFDVETIALHEIGHLNGLGHSAIGETEVSGSGRTVLAAEATMFPLAFGPGNVLHRTLRPDDIAGVSDLYPDDGFDGDTGSISGRVTKNGRGLFGAHIVAFNPATGALVGNFALNANGNFSIAGLTPGPHVLRVEPLDDADVDSFFEVDSPPDLNFRVVFHDKVIVAPRGGDSGSVEVKVMPK
jgi:hypothetical protein